MIFNPKIIIQHHISILNSCFIKKLKRKYDWIEMLRNYTKFELKPYFISYLHKHVVSMQRESEN